MLVRNKTCFVVLGIEPTSVERPSTPKAFAVSLLSAKGQSGFLPNNYAVEVAPYWLSSHPTLIFEDYYNAGFGQTLLQTLSFSLATSKMSDMDTLIIGTGVGFGIRAMLLAGKANSDLNNLCSQLFEIQNAILDIPEENEAVYTTLEDSLKGEAQKIALQIQKADKQRVGLRLEVAGAAAIDFSQDNFDEGKISRIGFWITPAYRLEEPCFDFIATARFIYDEENNDGTNLFDVGGRVVWQYTDFSFSGEFVGRFITDATSQKTNTYRLSATLEYQLSNNIYLISSFGRDYDQNGGEGNLISLFGINFGFGQIPSLKLI
ncbi:hypothetical protein ES703_97165 [subsurface metagenome]